MSSAIEHKVCENCGNQEMISDYHYKTEELYEFCDVCGYFHTISIKNMPDDNKYHDGWQPEYDEKESITGYVFKVFEKDKIGSFVSCIEKQFIKEALQEFKNDENVIKFGITCKNPDGFYQTQIFNKNNLK